MDLAYNKSTVITVIAVIWCNHYGTSNYSHGPLQGQMYLIHFDSIC